MKKQLDIVSRSPEQTFALAEKLTPHLREPNVVVLTGPLGAGKTVFVKGMARALEINEETISSPSFTMVHEYQGGSPLYHFDLYRMETPLELRELGWDDYLQREGLIVVEWGEKAGSTLPSRYYVIKFEIRSATERRISVSLRHKK